MCGNQALIEEVHGSSEDDDDYHAWDTDDLYSCSLGEPSVPEEYKNNSWGEITGRWYVDPWVGVSTVDAQMCEGGMGTLRHQLGYHHK